VASPYPLPTSLKRLRGNPGKRALPANEPQPDLVTAEVKPPSWLSPTAKAAWRKMAKVLTSVHVLTEADLPAFELLCDSYGKYVEANKEIAQTGGEVVVTSYGVGRNPWATQRDRAFAQFEKLAAQFGITPSARARVKSAVDLTQEDEMESILKLA
jgi:P27 family predicted phage terminase small subunit